MMKEYPPQSYTTSAAWRTLASLLLYILVYYALFRDLRSILLLVIVIIVHETGHFLAMKKFGYRDMKMFFVPFFGAFVSGQSGFASPFQRAIMILAGPLPGILTGIILFSCTIFTESDFLLQPALLFMLLNAINLLPVSPLDGGQFLQVLYPASNKILQTVFTLVLILVITWLAFRTRNYLLLLLDVFLFYRLSILFGGKHDTEKEEEYKHDEHEVIMGNKTAIYIMDKQKEMNSRQKAILLLLWLSGLIIPILIMFYLTINAGRFF
jgi:membrane-associated protease RseP (regulator of RpoE activity)